MKISIERNVLAKVLNKTTAIAKKENSPLPILSYALIEADGGIVKITTTTLEETIQIDVEGVIESEGKVCIPIARLKAITSESDGDVTMEVKEHRLNMTAGNAKFNLNILPAEDFPEAVEVEGEKDEFTIQGSQLAGLIDSVLFAASRDGIRISLNSVALHGCGARLKTVACDGHRIIINSSDCDCFEGIKLVPVQAAKQISQIAEEAGDRLVSLSIGKAFLNLVWGNIRYQARLIDCQYPAYEEVLQNSLQSAIASNVTIGREKLSDSLRLTNTVNGDKAKTITLKLNGGNSLGVSACNTDVGEASTEVEMTNFSGEPLNINFNSAYLLEGVSNMPGEKITMAFGNEISAAVLRTEGDEYPIQVIIPTR